MSLHDLLKRWQAEDGPPPRPVTELGSLPAEYVPRSCLARDSLGEIAALVQSLPDRKARELAFALKTTPGRLQQWAAQQIRG
jgi:hypothetical protein